MRTAQTSGNVSTPCIWFQRSFLETDIYRSIAELCERVRNTKGKSIPDSDFMVGWATVHHDTKKTYAMTMLAKPKHHPAIVELAVQMGEEVINM